MTLLPGTRLGPYEIESALGAGGMGEVYRAHDGRAALQSLAEDPIPLDDQRLILLASYWEFAGRRPKTADPASRSHLALLRSIAAEARARLRTA